MHMNTTTEWRQLKACSEEADSTKSRSVETASLTNAGVVATAAVDPPPRGRLTVVEALPGAVTLRGCASDRQRAASTQRFAGISCASASPAPPPQCRVSEGPAPHEPATCADLGEAWTPSATVLYGRARPRRRSAKRRVRAAPCTGGLEASPGLGATYSWGANGRRRRAGRDRPTGRHRRRCYHHHRHHHRHRPIGLQRPRSGAKPGVASGGGRQAVAIEGERNFAQDSTKTVQLGRKKKLHTTQTEKRQL